LTITEKQLNTGAQSPNDKPQDIAPNVDIPDDTIFAVESPSQGIRILRIADKTDLDISEVTKRSTLVTALMSVRLGDTITYEGTKGKMVLRLLASNHPKHSKPNPEEKK
jgi:endonuclease YncB( thermonuclease family)